jgi:acyl carrier protein
MRTKTQQYSDYIENGGTLGLVSWEESGRYDKKLAMPTPEEFQVVVMDALKEVAIFSAPEKITANTIIQHLAIDSLEAVEVIINIEHRLEITITNNDFSFSDLKYKSVAEYTQWMYERIKL